MLALTVLWNMMGIGSRKVKDESNSTFLLMSLDDKLEGRNHALYMKSTLKDDWRLSTTTSSHLRLSSERNSSFIMHMHS